MGAAAVTALPWPKQAVCCVQTLICFVTNIPGVRLDCGRVAWVGCLLCVMVVLPQRAWWLNWGFVLQLGGKCMAVGAYVQPMQRGEVCGALFSTAQQRLAGCVRWGTRVARGSGVCCCEGCCSAAAATHAYVCSYTLQRLLQPQYVRYGPAANRCLGPLGVSNADSAASSPWQAVLGSWVGRVLLRQAIRGELLTLFVCAPATPDTPHTSRITNCCPDMAQNVCPVGGITCRIPGHMHLRLVACIMTHAACGLHNDTLASP